MSRSACATAAVISLDLGRIEEAILFIVSVALVTRIRNCIRIKLRII